VDSVAASKRKRTRYVKGHSNRSLLYKLVEAHLSDDLSKLNKNHKVLYKLCTIKFIK
jgi:hypothetical protein